MSDWQIFVHGFDGKTCIVRVRSDASVDDLLEKICEQVQIDKSEVWAQFGGKPLSFGTGKKLVDYNIRDQSTVHIALRVRGGVKPGKALGLKTQPGLRELQGFITLTKEPCMISYDEDPNENRAKMPCGHAISQETMTSYCRSLLNENKYVFHCPYVGDLGDRCGQTWDYFLVRHVALMTLEEQQQFEKRLHENYAKKAMNMQQCPGCQSYCIRQDDAQTIVRCPVCTKRQSRPFDFCWGCLHTTDGHTSHCTNSECTGSDPRLNMLKKSPTKKIGTVSGCPSIRACPKCGIVIEHSDACKHMECTACTTAFCFVCLSIANKGVYPCGSWCTPCQPAPVQSRIAGSD